MWKFLFPVFLLFYLSNNTLAGVTVLVENSPSPGLQQYIQNKVDKDSSTFNYGLAVFDHDTVKISFSEYQGTRYVNFVFYSSYIVFEEVSVPTLSGYTWLFQDRKLYKLANYLYSFSYHSDKNMAYYMEAVYFCHCIKGAGKKIRGVYDCSFDDGFVDLDIYQLDYLKNCSEPESRSVETRHKKGKMKKESVPVPREWQSAFVEYGRESYVYVKEDKNFYEYIEDINKHI
ncbi:MAG TPA: hypothetical protein VHO03_16460 [Ignavibacteriales bacterium]|nr:hypothetical protein [Ignavibacteriales bacterium]